MLKKTTLYGKIFSNFARVNKKTFVSWQIFSNFGRFFKKKTFVIWQIFSNVLVKVNLVLVSHADYNSNGQIHGGLCWLHPEEYLSCMFLSFIWLCTCSPKIFTRKIREISQSRCFVLLSAYLGSSSISCRR
jgi:hypothetical protein